MDNSTYRKPTPDTERIKRSMLVGFLTVMTIIVSFYAVKTGKSVFMGAVIGVPVIIMMLSYPVRSLYMALIASFSSLSILKIGGVITDASVLFSFAAFSCFIPLLFHRARFKTEPEDRLIGVFVVITLIIMAMRGSGLKMLGSSTWGGSPYLLIFAAAFFYKYSRQLRVSNKAVVTVICLAVFVGVINSALLRAGFISSIDELSESGKVRLSWTKPLATALTPLALVIKWKRKWIPLVIWLAAFGLLGLSVYRSRLVSQLVLTAAFYYFLSTNRRAYIGKAMLAGCALWLAVLLVAPALPLGLQRAVSFVPGVHVSLVQSHNAENSTEWRFEIWKECLSRAPEYLLVGRGIAFDVMETVNKLGAFDVQQQSQWFMFLTHSYHSGPMTLLVDYGAPGLIAMLIIHFAFIRKCFRSGKVISGNNSHISRFACFFMASVLQQIFAFWFLFGKTESLCVTIFSMGVLYIAMQSEIEKRDAAVENNAEVSLPGTGSVRAKRLS